MNCTDYLEHVSSVVDSRLFGNLLEEFNDHTRQCKNCRNDYELEKLTRDYLKNTIKPLQAPDYLNQDILRQLNIQLGADTAKKKINLNAFRIQWKARYLGFAVAMIAVITIVTLIFYTNSPRHFNISPNDNNVIHLVQNYYDSVVEGTITHDFETNCVKTVKAQLKNIIDYDLKIPGMKDCLLMGATVTQYHGTKMAHFVFKQDNCLIYFSQLNYNCITKDRNMTLPVEAIEQLNNAGYYVSDEHKDCKVILLLKDNTLYTAASDMEENKLIAFLASTE